MRNDQHSRTLHAVFVAALALVLAACADDTAVDTFNSGSGGGTGGEEEGGDELDSTAEVGSADDSTGFGGEGDGGAFPCGYDGMLGGPGPGDYQLNHLPEVDTPDQYQAFVPSEDCVFDGIYDPDADDFSDPELNDTVEESGFAVFVYYPQDENDGWPDGQSMRPAVFFAPANGYDLVAGDGSTEADHRYRLLMSTLVEAGFVVFAIQPEAQNLNSGRRRSALACTMIWARRQWDGGDRLADFVALMGHSRGGGGAYLLAQDLLLETNLPDALDAPELGEWEQCGVATYAQQYMDETEFLVTPITTRDAPPFLSILSASDGDTHVRGIQAYDGRYSEALALSEQALDRFDEVALVTHGRNHQQWGGSLTTENAIGPYYIDQFLRWQMMGEDSSRRRFMDLVDAGVDTCAFDELPFADVDDCTDSDLGTICTWDGTGNETELFYRGCTGSEPPPQCGGGAELVGLGRPLIRADFGQGVDPPNADRLIIDSLDHEAESCDLYTTPGSDITLSTSGGTVTVTSGVTDVGPCVCARDFTNLLEGYTGAGAPEACDPDSDLGPPGTGSTVLGNPSHLPHEGGGMLVRFGDQFGPASVRWSLVPAESEGDDDAALNISAFTHLSVRIGNVSTQAPDSLCDDGYVPTEFEVSAEIEDTGMAAHVLPAGLFVESDHRDDVSCRSAHFMQTVRIPIARYCAEGMFDPYNATAITLNFDDPEESHVAFVDSVEFVRDPDGSALLPSCTEEVLDSCPAAAPSGWNCEATGTLVALEVSCEGEPISGVCDGGDVVSNEVDLPLVDEGLVGEFEGWVVHVPRGWIRDPGDPTEDELDDITARCIAACELEFADRPEIAANCSGTGAFETPTLRATPDRGARVAIADSRADGSGLFTGASLDCDLRDDCADAFDEDLAIARPRRPTSMEQPLDRGVEWQLDVSGTVEADSTVATTNVMASLSGSIGYSECAAGNDDGPCPFYLGSLELTLDEPLTISLECGGPPEVHVLEELSVRLVQPALGIAEEDTDWRAFPSGALVLAAEGVVDSQPFSALGPARRDFQLVAADGWVQMQGLGGSYVELTIPCGEDTADVVAWLGFSADGWPGEPPDITIDVPSEVECPSTVELEKTASDQENDIVSVRWRVDGVLLDEAVTEIPFTQAHELTAIVRDSRGATTTAVKQVGCE